MNTTAKGDLLEDKVFRYMKKFVSDGKYGKHVAVYKRHKYFSSKTLSDKIVDVSVEIRDEEEDERPMFMIVIECKNLGRKVDISDVEEFNSKLEGISSRAIRGVVVTTIGFSTNTINYARNTDITLIRLNPDVEVGYEFVLKREINDPALYWRMTYDSLSGPNCKDSVVIFNNGTFSSLKDLASSFGLKNEEDKLPVVEFLSKEYITNMANSLRGELHCGECICEEAINYSGLSVKYGEMPITQLGRLLLNSSIIEINDILANDVGRKNFTLAHELGHWMLHKTYFQDYIESIGEDEHTLDMFDGTSIGRLEVQANMFASFFLMPEESFRRSVSLLFDLHSINRGRLFLDEQPCNKDNYYRVVSSLAKEYNVSMSAASNRMKALGLLIVSRRSSLYV